jgi:hypothetical protein
VLLVCVSICCAFVYDFSTENGHVVDVQGNNIAQFDEILLRRLLLLYKRGKLSLFTASLELEYKAKH